jgi:hypothetical protein
MKKYRLTLNVKELQGDGVWLTPFYWVASDREAPY